MAKKIVSIVITTRNRKEIILDCLVSLFKMDYPNFEIIVVDNGSKDGTVLAVKKKFPQVKIISSKENLGLNGGKNLGQKYVKGDYIFFLDSDTIVDKKILKELVNLAESNPKIGMVCPKMYYWQPKNFIWYAGTYVNLLTSQTKNLGANEKDNGQWDQVRETEFAPTAYLVKKEVVKKLKGHDEIFFMTYGDTDYGYRVREAGFKVLFCPAAKLWHRLKMEENIKGIRSLGYNLPMRAYYFARNRTIFMKKHAPKLNFFIFIFFFFPLFTLYMVYKIFRFSGSKNFLKPYLHGVFDSLKYLFTNRVYNVYK